jgi:drug/metabolite transporter (DMT)-like permease
MLAAVLGADSPGALRSRLGSTDALLLVVVLVWSFHFAVVKYSLTHGFEPLGYSMLRYGLGSLAFVSVAYGLERTIRVSRRDLWLLGGLLGLIVYVNQISFATAANLATASTVALLFGTLPIFVALIGWRLGVERPSRRHLVAVAVSFTGVAMVATEAEGGLSGSLGGVLLGLVAAVTWALYSVMVGPLMTRYSPYRIGAVVGLVATVPIAATAAPQLGSFDVGAVTPLAWGALAYSALLSYVVTNVLWFKAIHREGANRAAMYANLQPFLGALFAVVVLSETITALQIAGGVVIAAGIILTRPRRPPPENID